MRVSFEVPKKYKSLVKKFELVSGEITCFAFKVKNLGDRDFPGGAMSVVFNAVSGMETLTVSTPSIELSSMKPKTDLTVERKLDIVSPGLWYLAIEIDSNDKRVVEYLSYEGQEERSKDRWITLFQVVNRHELEIISLMKKLVKAKKGGK